MQQLSAKAVTVAGLLLGTCGVAYSGPTTFVCDYKTYSNAEGLHSVKNKFEITFILDRDQNKAYIVGNNGSNPVHIVDGVDAITFLEVTDYGNVMSTTIAGQRSVHSRNTVMKGRIIPSQYHGTCVIR